MVMEIRRECKRWLDDVAHVCLQRICNPSHAVLVLHEKLCRAQLDERFQPAHGAPAEFLLAEVMARHLGVP